MSKTRNLLVGVVALLVLSVAAQATSLVGNWAVIANGYHGTMTITSQDTAGNVIGTIFGNPMKGFWNDAAGQLTFYRAINGSTTSTPPEQIQVYTGYLFPYSVSTPGGSQTLAGYYEAFAGTGGTSSKNRVGWYATK